MIELTTLLISLSPSPGLAVSKPKSALAKIINGTATRTTLTINIKNFE